MGANAESYTVVVAPAFIPVVSKLLTPINRVVSVRTIPLKVIHLSFSRFMHTQPAL